MLSDVLADALGDIDHYRTAMPNIYGKSADAIAKVKTVMTALLRYYDACPMPHLLAPLEELLNSIRSLETSRIEESIIRLHAAIREQPQFDTAGKQQ